MNHLAFQRLLSRPRISIVTSHPDAEVLRLQALLGDHLIADGRTAFERILGDLVHARGELPFVPKTLDLIGHSTTDGLLRLGDWVIDAERPSVTAFFRGIADLEVLPRLGVTALRILGCSTAVSMRARATLSVLSEILGLDVLGTVGPIYSLHYDADGFSHQWRFMLSSSRESPSLPVQAPPPVAHHRALDVDSLPVVPLTRLRERARHVVHGEAAREILGLVNRTRGAQMPGLLAIPTHELALLVGDHHCHVVEIILDGCFLRVYPDGENAPGIVYPVSDPRRLIALVAGLPLV